jgi:hypothetical protein
MHLGGVEPKPWQGIAVEARHGVFVPVTARSAIPDYGCIHAVAQVFKVALDGGRGDLKLFEQGDQGHCPVALQQVVDLVEAFRSIHHPLPVVGLILPLCRPDASANKDRRMELTFSSLIQRHRKVREGFPPAHESWGEPAYPVVE